MISSATVSFDDFISIEVKFFDKDGKSTALKSSHIVVNDIKTANRKLIEGYNRELQPYPSYVKQGGRFHVSPYDPAVKTSEIVSSTENETSIMNRMGDFEDVISSDEDDLTSEWM